MTALSFAAVTIGIGALMLVPLAIAEHTRRRAHSRRSTPAPSAALAYVAIFPSILAVLCYNRGVQLIGANRAGPFLHLIPLFGVDPRDRLPRRAAGHRITRRRGPDRRRRFRRRARGSVEPPRIGWRSRAARA